ncbi:porin, partial [Brevibacterium sp. UMB10442]|nr:porin [Brevibacterium sp. UMB10442]
ILMVTNTDNDKFADYYAPNAQSVEGTGKSVRDLEPTKNGLTYIANWNGSFLGDKLRTRWAWGLLTQAKHKYSRMMSLGQQLNLPKVQWYFDYM